MTTPSAPALTVIIVSYNTVDLTLAALRTLFATTQETSFRCVVYDNASADGSAEAIAREFPQVELIASQENLGFARANNLVAEAAQTEWVLLLNPDTEVHPGAVDALMAFARAHPEAGIYGGRTVFPDGSLNIASCWNRITPWSAFCSAVGLRAIFPKSGVFNPEAMGDWARDSVRKVDIVVGCFLLMPTALWRELGGFDLKYFMYGEEADLCLRAARLGYQPMITPEAEIMHIVGASSNKLAHKVVMVAKARSTLIRDHWSPALVPLGLVLMWLWAALRYGASRPLGWIGKRETASRWAEVWAARRDWLAGY
ncbi:glycosyl transferase, family 2 [Roseobacter sp. SK209-2-6]|uniref:glycosyltransferase family 2 protein n=1 Tax=Roseobacter sp. SK209-2-6 TaxID=388739 RepID=UPI0000F3F1B1|nr:glycosyltransferase family 2 protein [Roseobacter sp. SK209-2-6]EBA14567.1 glycosyl transferase, family 2 [Roseobacter sp. SK209-2-6]